MSSGPGHGPVVPAGRLVPGFEVPARLARNAADDAEHGPARRAWLEALPHTVAELADRWSLRVGRPFEPGGNASWPAPGPGRLAGDPAGFAGRMAGLLGLDPGRLRSWLFARCVQESVGVPHLRAAAVQLAP